MRCSRIFIMGDDAGHSLVFKCDLQQGHTGYHVSNAEPPRKVAIVLWPNEEGI